MVFIIKSVSWQSKGSCPTPSSAPVTPRRLWLCTRCTIWGLRIPEDVAVIGVDNVSMSAMVEPPLSTMTQHLYDMGMEAAKSLIRQIEYKDKYGELPKPQRMIMNSDLIVRRSTK